MKSILVILDPEQSNEAAIAKAAVIANVTGADIRLYLCMKEPSIDFHGTISTDEIKLIIRKAEQEKLDKLVKKISPITGITDSKLVFHQSVIEGIIDGINIMSPSLVIKESDYHPSIKRTLYTHLDWQLIRQCPTPLLLAKTKSWPQSPKILVSIDPMHEDGKPASLDNTLITEAVSWSHLFDSSLTVFHSANTDLFLTSYTSPDNTFINSYKIKHKKAAEKELEAFSTTSDQLIVKEGKIESTLPDIIEKNNIDLVVMGVMHRNPVERLLIGSTAEKVLDKISSDVLLFKP